MAYSIAIDGPAGAGKSTIAKKIAKDMEYIYVDTGAMYRAMAIYFLDNNIDRKNEEAINKACESVDINIIYENGVQQVILNGVNVTGRLRNEEVGIMASTTSAYKSVREKLVEIQRRLSKGTNIVMDGRDIGTVVLPDATLKIFLTASVEARAKRRYDELVEKGEKPVMENIKEDIITRDYNDTHRDISPLRQADDAVFVDSSDYSVDEVVEVILTEFEKRKH